MEQVVVPALDVNEILALVVVRYAALLLIEGAAGAMVSWVQLYEAALEVLPAASRPRTWNVCEPSARVPVE
jgi:hypothetical protein